MTTSIAVGSAAPDYLYRNAQGEQHRLADLWGESPVLILWLRHFG